MIRFWEIVLERPEDLGVLHDALVDAGWDEGAEAVAWLIKNRKWPTDKGDTGWAGPSFHWGFYQTPHTKFRDSEDIVGVFGKRSEWQFYADPTEAVWGFVHAWPHRTKKDDTPAYEKEHAT